MNILMYIVNSFTVERSKQLGGPSEKLRERPMRSDGDDENNKDLTFEMLTTNKITNVKFSKKQTVRAEKNTHTHQ